VVLYGLVFEYHDESVDGDCVLQPEWGCFVQMLYVFL